MSREQRIKVRETKKMKQFKIENILRNKLFYLA